MEPLDEEEASCPLCMVEYDSIDKHYTPCSYCRYRICRFCWFRISLTPPRSCPGCRGKFLLRRVFLSLRKVEPHSTLSSLTGIKILNGNWSVALKLISILGYFEPDTEIPLMLLQNAPILKPLEVIEEFRRVKLVDMVGGDAFRIRGDVQVSIRRCFGEQEALEDASRLLTTEFLKMSCVRNIQLITRTVPHSLAVWRHIAVNPGFVRIFCKFPSNLWAWFFQQDHIDSCLDLAYELDRTMSVVFASHEHEYINSKLRIGIGLMKLCRFNEALPILERVYECTINGPHQSCLNMLLTCGSFLALTLTEMGKFSEGLKIFERILPTHTFNPEDRFQVGVYLRKGITLSKLGKDNEAKKIFEICYHAFSSMHTEKSRATSNAKRWLAFTLARMGKFHKALRLYKEVYQVELIILRPGHPSISQTLAGTGRALILMGRAQEAFKLCGNELNNLKTKPELENQFAIMTIYRVLAMSLIAMKRFGMAKAVLGWIYGKYRKMFGLNHPYTFRAWQEYSDAA